ncbi:flavodoxin family protein [Candidatus Soleaferrea massiliensis]|uniref:flavodoxin family protein n=1 Tax=Candidatus Soleaferrea massiliensis TaxID=1470354 RepID=UPI000591014F|nr:flavodoxin family protein [Candidatus Soleaferrea massiliensis]
MGEKKVLAILGSPHKAGATASMLDYTCKEAMLHGWHVDRINLYEKQIAFCSGCRSCLRTKKCVLDDGITEIARLLKHCDVVILAAPTYWANVPAVVKNMFDRLLGVAMEETKTFPKPRLSPKQRYILLTACNTPFPFSSLCGQSSGAVHAMREFFKTAGMKCSGKFVFSGAAGRSELPGSLKRKLEKCWAKTGAE